MAYIELKIADIACIIYQKRNLLTPIFTNLLLMFAKLFPQIPQFIFCPRLSKQFSLSTHLPSHPLIHFHSSLKGQLHKASSGHEDKDSDDDQPPPSPGERGA